MFRIVILCVLADAVVAARLGVVKPRTAVKVAALLGHNATRGKLLTARKRVVQPASGSGEECHPRCKWNCGSADCNAVCKPICAPPKCDTFCAEPTDCRLVCPPPMCAVVCPTVQCTTGTCPKCQTVCGPPQCVSQCHKNCESKCADPQCTWQCGPPEGDGCQQPQCKMECERPKQCFFDDKLHKAPDGPPFGMAIMSRGLATMNQDDLLAMTAAPPPAVAGPPGPGPAPAPSPYPAPSPHPGPAGPGMGPPNLLPLNPPEPWGVR